MCNKKLFQKLLFIFQIRKIPQSWQYLIIKFMEQTRMPEIFCSDDLFRNFMVLIEPEA